MAQIEETVRSRNCHAYDVTPEIEPKKWVLLRSKQCFAMSGRENVVNILLLCKFTANQRLDEIDAGHNGP